MGSTISVRLVEKGPFDVDAGNEPSDKRIGVTKRRDDRQPRAHRVEIISNDRGEDAAYTVSFDSLARRCSARRQDRPD